MAHRPNWYPDSPQRGGWEGIKEWSGFRIILTVTLAAFALQTLILIFSSGGSPGIQGLSAVSRPTGWESLHGWFGLRAWVLPTEGGIEEMSFNPLFPLQLITYQFFHSATDIGHLFWNMLFLWFFGVRLESALGRTAFLRLYLGGGVLGGILYWATALLLGSPAPVVGASGAVYAIMVLYAMKWPRTTILLFFFLPVPIYLVVLFKVFYDVMGFWQVFMYGAAAAGGVAYAAHLGGALMGLIWAKKGDVVGRKVAEKQMARVSKERKKDEKNRREMDRLLAKIQSEGLVALTDSERAFLQNRSEELREKRT